jgi:hypothetical protein
MNATPMLAYRPMQGGFTLEGVLDEASPQVLDDLAAHAGLQRSVVFDVGGIKRINSLGVRAWINFMKKVAGRTIHFRRCSTAFVEQINMVSDFRGGGGIESVLAPYMCETSGTVFYEELVAGVDLNKGGYKGLESRPCKQCPKPMVFDDLPERYFVFLAFL